MEGSVEGETEFATEVGGDEPAVGTVVGQG